jgi:mono/diheme cytochrome c family protein
LFAALLISCVAQATPAVLADYMLNCQGCHLPDGTGYAEHGVPDLKFSGTLLQLAGGREYLVRVPGVAQSGLDDARLAALLNWVLQRFGGDSLPANFRRYTAAEVAAWRQQPYADAAAARLRLLQQPASSEPQAL